MKLSEFVIFVMKRLLRNPVEKGEIHYGQRIKTELEFDQEECEKILEELCINKENVLRYLGHKYIPTWHEGEGNKGEKIQGATFVGQKCIQKVNIIDGKLYIFIYNSEIHKVITDSIHVMNLLDAQGLTFDRSKVFYIIENLKVVYQDLLIYMELLMNRGEHIPAILKDYKKDILMKFPTLHDIAKIKKRSIKRKYLRYFVLKGYLEWKDLRKIISIENYSDIYIKKTCFEVVEKAKERGVDINWNKLYMY